MKSYDDPDLKDDEPFELQFTPLGMSIAGEIKRAVEARGYTLDQLMAFLSKSTQEDRAWVHEPIGDIELLLDRMRDDLEGKKRSFEV